MRLFVQMKPLTIFTWSFLFNHSILNQLEFCCSLSVDVSNFFGHPLKCSAVLVCRTSISIFDMNPFCMCSKSPLLDNFFHDNLSIAAAKQFCGSTRTSEYVLVQSQSNISFFRIFSFLFLFFFSFILLYSHDDTAVLIVARLNSKWLLL